MPPSIRMRVPRDRGAGPTDEHLDRFGSGAVDRRHLLGGDDREHGVDLLDGDDSDGDGVGVAQSHDATTSAPRSAREGRSLADEA